MGRVKKGFGERYMFELGHVGQEAVFKDGPRECKSKRGSMVI